MVFGRLIPVKSNLAYELYQSQCLQADGVLQGDTFRQHPYTAPEGTEGREYQALGEMAFMDRKRQQFWDAARGAPWDFAGRVGQRLLAATLVYGPLDQLGEASRPWSLWLSRLAHPLAFLSLLALVLAAPWRRLQPAQWVIIGAYVVYLLPYIGMSYYQRYAVPLLGVKALLIAWAASLALALLTRRPIGSRPLVSSFESGGGVPEAGSGPDPSDRSRQACRRLETPGRVDMTDQTAGTDKAGPLLTGPNSPAGAKAPPAPWPRRRILLWWSLLTLACWYQEPSFPRALRPEFADTGGGVFLPDFFQDWASARNYREGIPVYAHQEVTVERYLGQRWKPKDHGFPEINAHPPTSVLLVVPFAFLDFQDAFCAWNVLSLAALAGSVFLIARQLRLSFSGWALLPGLTLLLVCDPFWRQMFHGQFNLLLLFSITAAWAAERSGRPGWAGCFLGVAAALKIFPVFLFLSFALRREWRALASGAAVIAGLALVTAAVLGPDVYQSYLKDALPHGALYRSAWHNLSLPALWAKLFEPTKRLPGVLIEPLTHSPLLAAAGGTCSVAVVLIVLARVLTRARSRAECDLAFGLAVIAMLLVWPVTWEHYCLLLALPLVLLWPRLVPSGPARLAFGSALVVLWLPTSLVVNHCMILMGATIQPGVGWVATPWDTVTALSVRCYALVGLFALGAWSANFGRTAGQGMTPQASSPEPVNAPPNRPHQPQGPTPACPATP